MKNLIFTFISLSTLASALAVESSSLRIENSCKIKAKEVAATTYKSCVTESRAQELSKIKQAYQQKLKDIKAEYEADLKRLGGTSKSASQNKITSTTTSSVDNSSGEVIVAPATASQVNQTETATSSLPVIEAPEEDTSTTMGQ